MTKIAVGLSVISGIVIGVLCERSDETARWGTCTASQVTSKDTRTAVEIRRDMER